MLDPGHYNNCWIWTEKGYTANGSTKAYCFVKNKGASAVPISEDPFDNVWDAHDNDMGEHHHHNDNHDHDHTHGNGSDADHTHGTPAINKPRVFCNKYKKFKGCVSGNNIKKHSNKTLKQCEEICNRTNGCKGFEYFVASGQRSVSNIYKPGDCQPQSSANMEGCDYKYYQVQFWRKDEYDCTDSQ